MNFKSVATLVAVFLLGFALSIPATHHASDPPGVVQLSTVDVAVIAPAISPAFQIMDWSAASPSATLVRERGERLRQSVLARNGLVAEQYRASDPFAALAGRMRPEYSGTGQRIGQAICNQVGKNARDWVLSPHTS